MTLMTRYVDPGSLMIRTELIQLIHVDATDCCANKLLEEFTNGFEQNKIPLDNLIGLACDNAPVTVGMNNSFQKHLTKRLPHLLTIPCICHSLALIASDACKAAIRGEVDEIISGILNFVNGSLKRLAEFEVFQRGFNQKSELLRFAPTRWLSRQIAISRILDNWDAMLSYLTEQSLMNNVAIAKKLLSVMGDPVTKAYLLFLKFALDSLEKMNAQFQSSKTLVHKLQPSSKKLLVEVLQRFMKPDLLDPTIFKALNIDFKSIENHRDESEVDVGTDCEDYLRSQLELGIPESVINEVRSQCKKFFVTAAEQIHLRLPFNDTFLSDLTVFSKERALLDSDRESSISRLQNICTTLAIPEGNLQEEWRFLYIVSASLKDRWCQLSFDDMWGEICTFKSLAGTVQFPTLRVLLSIIRALPYSNAPAERAISMIPDVKTKKGTV